MTWLPDAATTAALSSARCWRHTWATPASERVSWAATTWRESYYDSHLSDYQRQEEVRGVTG